MYTDVVGYSKLTGDNQQLALIILEEHNKILEESTKKYSGKIVKLTGDGLCALFDSPVNGIKCSIEIQTLLSKRNKLNVKERQIQIRIGLHYGTYELKDDDVFGDGVNLAKNIEPVAPHGGIAISEVLNDLVWDINDLYISKYTILKFNSVSIQLFEVCLDLISWCNNKNELQVLDAQKMYNKAHELFHIGDYSSAIKFAFLSKENSNKKDEIDTYSFICHTFISLGDMEYARNLLKNIDDQLSQKASEEQSAHFYKMRGNLEFNFGDKDKSLDFFTTSLKLMLKSNERYVNEIIYYLSLILLEKNKYNDLKKYLDKSIKNHDSYSIILLGVKMLISDSFDKQGMSQFIHLCTSMKNQYLSCLAYRIMAKIFFKFKDYDKAKNAISKSQKLVLKSSKMISDQLERDKFLNQIIIHKDIMEFSDKISDYFLKMTVERINDKDNGGNSSILSIFCTNCGFKNEKKYNFCIDCGCNLNIN